MNPELIKIAQQLMQQNPGMTPEQALREAQRMSQGAQSEDFTGGQAREAGRLGHMAQQQYAATQGGPAMGQVPGDRPQVMPGLLGGNQPTPQGQAPHPGIQRPPTPGLSGGKDAAWCAQMGGTVQGGSCVISLQF
jgi:hypothetical protein